MDKNILAQKLAALSSEGETFENGRRVISDGAEPGILTAILAEIDMTVLPRKLTFRMQGSEVTLVAGGRRLRGLVKASKDIRGVVGVLGKSLSRDDAEVIDGLRGILDQFASKPGQLTVESDEPDALGGQTDAGITAESLAAMWEVPLAVGPISGMQQFIRDCGPLVTAWIILSDTAESSNGGDGTQLAAIKKALDQQWPTFSRSVDQLAGDQGFICLNNALGDAGSVAIAKDADEAALICYDAENMTELHGRWTQAQA